MKEKLEELLTSLRSLNDSLHKVDQYQDWTDQEILKCGGDMVSIIIISMELLLEDEEYLDER